MRDASPHAMAPIVVEFQYEMFQNARTQPTKLWLFYDADAGVRLVNYRRFGEPPSRDLDSGWHGRWEPVFHIGALRLWFNYRGEEPLRSCEMHRTFQRHVLIGADYQWRFIRMTYLKAYRLDWGPERWAPIYDTPLREEDEWTLVVEAALAPVPSSGVSSAGTSPV